MAASRKASSAGVVPVGCCPVGEKTDSPEAERGMRCDDRRLREARCGRDGERHRGERRGPDWHDLLDRSNHHLDPAEVLLQRSKNGIWEARRKCRDWTSYRVIHEVSWGRLVAAGDFWAGDWSESAGRAVLNASWQAVGNWEDGLLGRRSGRRLVGNRVWSRGGPDDESYLLFLGK